MPEKYIDFKFGHHYNQYNNRDCESGGEGTGSMQKKYICLLKVMLETSKEFLNSHELAEMSGISPRTVIRYIRELKDSAQEYGFVIHTLMGRGYQLEITDRDRFKNAISSEEDEEVTAVLFRLLLEQTCKLDDLAELLHYSRPGMARVMEKVEQNLGRQGFRLLNKPYVGFFISGNEIHIRNYLYHLLENLSMEKTQKLFGVSSVQIEQIKTYINGELSRKSVAKSAENEKFFLRYMFAQAGRIRIGKTIRTDYFANISQTAHLQSDMDAALHIMNLAGYADCPEADKEIETIYLALVYRQAFWQNGLADAIDEKNLQFYQELTQRAFERIKANYKVDLLQDDILVNGLILHIASNFSRYLLGMETENLFYNDVLETYPTAYYYAMEVAEEISAWTKLSLSKYEISFLGMHFASYLERNLKSKQWKCAIICGSGAGSAKLLESRLRNKYQRLEIIGIYPADEMESVPAEADFYITTFTPNGEKLKGKTWIELSPVFDIKEQIALEQLLGNLNGHPGWNCRGVQKYFLQIDRGMEKQELLEHLCGLCEKKGMISRHEANGILGREELVSTEITEGIAMPHGLIAGASFLVFALLKEPVIWGRTEVKLVVLGCFQRGDERMKEELEYLFRLFLNESDKQELLASRTAEQMEEYMGEYYGK